MKKAKTLFFGRARARESRKEKSRERSEKWKVIFEQSARGGFIPALFVARQSMLLSRDNPTPAWQTSPSGATKLLKTDFFKLFFNFSPKEEISDDFSWRLFWNTRTTMSGALFKVIFAKYRNLWSLEGNPFEISKKTRREKIEKVEKRKSRINAQSEGEKTEMRRVAGRATPRVTARPTRLRASSWVSKAPDHVKRDKEVPCENQKKHMENFPEGGRNKDIEIQKTMMGFQEVSRNTSHTRQIFEIRGFCPFVWGE